METFLSGFAVVCLLVFSHARAEDFQHCYLRAVFILDVVAPGTSLATAARSPLSCAGYCLQQADCKTSAYHEHSATCWLYHHLVGYTTTGMASNGTRYFWRLSPSCPGELGYQLEAGICLKVYSSLKNRTEAETTCREDEGHLLIADTPEKRQIVKNIAKSGVWLGASDEDREGEWRWMDGSLMTGHKWTPGNPSNGNGKEHFLEMNFYGDVNDLADGDRRNVACQVPVL